VTNEDLYRELRQKEMEEDALYRQNQAPKAMRNVEPPKVDFDKAMKRYNEEIKPVFERRKRAQTSLAYRLFLKATGNWKGMEAKDVELVNPTRGLVMTGPTMDEMRAMIAADPKAYRHLMKNAPAVQSVPAEHRSILPRPNEG
jgi:hypothetical protein